MKCILVGTGEVGQAVHEVFSPHHLIDTYDIKDERKPVGPYEVLLVAIPYSPTFVEQVNAYRMEWKVRCTIVFSTVAMGTTRRIPGAVHSPVEGKHPELARSMRLMPRWCGGKNDLALRFFRAAHIEPIVRHKPETTELIKIESTTTYGVNIENARRIAANCAVYGVDYADVKEFNRHYNRLYANLGLPQYSRYILDPPQGNIKGHCILPNAKLLREACPHPFLDEMLRDHEEGDPPC